MSATSVFRSFAEATSRWAGRPVAFLAASLIIVGWAATGPLFHFGDTWQLVINTGTTIVTFLMVFLIQNTQNRDSAALQLKLDELIRATRAHNALLDLEELEDTDLDRIRSCYRELARRARPELYRIEEELLRELQPRKVHRRPPLGEAPQETPPQA